MHCLAENPLINSIKVNGYVDRGSNSTSLHPFLGGATLNGKNLLLQEQILPFKSISHVKELQHPMKQVNLT